MPTTNVKKFDEIWIASSVFSFPCIFRLPDQGESFHPYKAPGSKRIKRIWSDLKRPWFERNILPVLCSSTNQLIWLPCSRLSHWAGAIQKQFYDHALSINNLNHLNHDFHNFVVAS